MMNISTVFFANEIIALTLGTLANAILFYLIVYASTHDLKSYTRLLKLHCACDLVYLLINALTSLRVIYIGKQIFMIISGPLIYWKSGAIVGCSLFTYAFISELTFVPIDYYYRFVLVCHNDPFTNFRFGICVISAILLTAIHTIVSINSTTYGPSKETLKYWPKIKNILNLGGKPTPFGVLDPDSQKMTITLTSASLITFCVYLIIGYCTYRIHKTLSENAKRQVRKESSHVRQITMVMIMQAVLPFMVLALPIIIVTIFSVFGVSVEVVGYLITIALSWTPVLKPVITIWIIRPYRRRFKRVIFSRAETTNTMENSLSNVDATKSSKVDSCAE